MTGAQSVLAEGMKECILFEGVLGVLGAPTPFPGSIKLSNSGLVP